MPLDAACPKCKVSFPVTEARHAFTVECPKCDTEMTVEFKKPAATPEAGQPHYELKVKPGALASAPVPPPKRKKDDDDDEPARRGGSAAVVFLSGGFGLLCVLGGLGLTAWVLFGLIDTTPAVANNSRPNNNQPNNNAPNNPGRNATPNNPNKGNGPGPGPVIPPKPKDEFELKPVAGTPQPITPLPLDLSTSQVINLPGPAAAVSVGGNGRYIVMHIPSKNQLLCFDASQGKTFIGAEPADNGNVLLAAGQNRAVALVPGNILRVYELPSLQRRFDASGPPLPPHNATSIAMGSATNGPLLACTAFGEVVLMDVGGGTIGPIDGSKGNIGGDLTTPVRASANGKVFVRGGYGNDSKTVIATERGRKWHAVNSEVCDAYPSADGKHVFGYGMTVYSNSAQIAGNRAPAGVWYVPAVSGTHFLRLTETKNGNTQTLSVSVHKNHLAPDREKVTPIVLPEIEGLVGAFGGTLALDQHLFLIPEAKMLVTLNPKKDTLTLRKVDIK